MASWQCLAGVGEDIKDSLCPGWGPPEYLLRSRAVPTQLVLHPDWGLINLCRLDTLRAVRAESYMVSLSVFLQRLREVADS